MVDGSIFVRSHVFFRRSWRFAGALYFSHFIDGIRINISISIISRISPNQCALTLMTYIASILLLILLSRFSSTGRFGQRYNYILTPPNAKATNTLVKEHTKAESAEHRERWTLIRRRKSQSPKRPALVSFLASLPLVSLQNILLIEPPLLSLYAFTLTYYKLRNLS